MGQQNGGYLDAINWDERLTVEQRMERGPFQAAFGIGHSDTAATAVERARREASTAEAVFSQVKIQAVYALLDSGMSIRMIATETGLPKSEVGRIARALDKNGGATISAAGVGVGLRDHAERPHGYVRERIRAAWGHR
ncbi:MAG: hypothetical protein L0H59_07005 [Tomitella sp.]|nr:hypothetical protein [Tomitella sp.]